MRYSLRQTSAFKRDYKRAKERVADAKRQLADILKAGGSVVETIREYEAHVNEGARQFQGTFGCGTNMWPKCLKRRQSLSIYRRPEML